MAPVDKYPLDTAVDLPEAPKKLVSMVGPSLVLLGLGLGSGEIILWPYMTSNYGLGIVWAIVIGITMQFFINMEVERYALIYGESIFVGFARWLRVLPLWFILSTFVGFGWPGIGLAGSTLLAQAFSIGQVKYLAMGMFVLMGLILALGKQVYTTVETLQKYLISVGSPAIVILAFFLAKPTDWQALGAGLVGRGDGYSFLPAGIAMSTFLGALAFAGAGGNLNLAQSFYIRDKGYGMGKFAAKIRSLFIDRTADQEARLAGRTFPLSLENMARFKRWWKMINLEHFLVFWLLGLVTIVMLSLLAFTTTYGHPDNPEGIKFVINEAVYIGRKLAPFVGTLFLLATGLMLTATQLTVLDSTSRIITENLILLRGKSTARVSRLYYIVLWLQIAFGMAIIFSGSAQPRDLIVLSACINAFAMFVYTALIMYLNNVRLEKPLRPSWWRNLALAGTFIFYGVFVVLAVRG